MNGPGSLQNLNDIVVSGPVPWWPPAPGWYAVAAALVLVAAVFAWRGWRRWRRDAYRRQALAELAAIRGEASAAELQQVPALLKRTALSAWPRPVVAGLSGRDWHRFLDESAGMTEFSGAAGRALDRLAYGGEAGGPDTERLLDAAESWISRHRNPEARG